ncbi:hypothetical protein DFH07DRAFT_819677 [Mycena maculata]|uniref:Uncharacterized protein n=1 Tax=Mycena maculata TaxID=230809 RepID=A0AAD7NEH3_9AGAR|nr:hypothetical protein DFH07DRAFT_819677 [Mycena maculata]
MHTTQAVRSLDCGPLVVQELVDYCIDFLHASPPDLKACAIVNRSWTHSAQIHLFNHIVIGAPGYTYGDKTCLATTRRRCRRLWELLNASRRHIEWIKSIQIHLDSTPPDTFTLFADLTFTHLRRVSVSGNWVEGTGVQTVQELLSVPTLTAISISGNFMSLSLFAHVLERCCANINDVSFCNIKISPAQNSLVDVGSSDRRITIDSLDLWWSDNIHDWLNSPQCPFNFSNLRRLRLNENTSLPNWDAFVASVPRVEYLQFQPLTTDLGLSKIDLASFTNLKCIEIFVEYKVDLSKTFAILSTMARPNHIQTIRFRFPHPSVLDADSGAKFDQQVLALPMPHLAAVELVYLEPTATYIADNFPRLNARRLLRIYHG